jgi:hypothetical protein
MPTITGQQIINRAWIKAQDTTGATGIRWPADEALLWLNDGQREIVNVLPKAFPKMATPVVSAGTRQTFSGLLLGDAITLLDVTRNLSNTLAAGRAITKRDRAWIDEQRPNWHNEPTADQAYHWFADEREPKAFYLYPALNAGRRVEVIYSAMPPDLAGVNTAAALANVIALDDIYANALQFFVLFSFYSKDANYTKTPQIAAGYYEMFLGSLGIRNQNVMNNAGAGNAKAATGG